MKKSLALLASAAAVLIGVSACSSGTPSSTGGATGGAADSAGVAAATAMIAGYTGVPTFTPPGAALDGAKIGGGKTMLIIPSNSSIPYNTAFDDATKAGAAKVGMNASVYDNNGTPDEWARGVEYGIAQKVNVIALVAGLDVNQIIPQIQEATAAGIAVIGSTYQGVGIDNPAYLTASIPLDYAKAGEIQANYSISKQNGNVNALIIDSSGLTASQSMTPAVKATFAKNCPSCKLTVLDIPVTQWATQIQTQVVAALTADPTINYILPNYDAEVQPVTAALQVKGMMGQVGIATFNGTPSAMALVASGDVTMDVGQNITWAGYATVDAALRILGDVPPNSGVIDEHIPLRIFDSSNIAEAGNPPNLTDGYGDTANQYLKLWGLS